MSEARFCSEENLLARVSHLESEAARLSRELSSAKSEMNSLKHVIGSINNAGPATDLLALRAPRRNLPRPIRVLRKRLRAMGLWPTAPTRSSNCLPNSDSAGKLERVSKTATPNLAPYLKSIHGYDAWLAANVFTSAQERDLRQALERRSDLPTISIITPVYNTPPCHLAEMFSSVEAQVYNGWELCLVDDGSTAPATLAALSKIEASSPKVKCRRLISNSGIAEATNAAAALATGEIIVFLDHDDRLTPDALAELALYYAERPDADFVYSDDDKIDDQGRRFAPQFKPDWSPTLLMSFMYMSHVVSVRRSLFEQLGGVRASFDGAQDYDFALRATEIARHIGHIPRVLYHWRATVGSTAQSGDAKPESFDAGLRALQQALDRRGVEGRAMHPQWARDARIGMFSIDFPDSGPNVTIVVPTYNQASLLKDCIESLALTSYANYEVLIVDNGSDDAATLDYLDALARRSRHRVITIPRQPGGFSYAALMNEAVQHIDTEFVLFLNNDTRVIAPRWLSQMVGYGRMQDVGAVGARLYFADGTLQHGGIVHGYHEGLAGHAFRGAAPHDWGYLSFVKAAREYSAVTAACMLTPRALFNKHGGFDEDLFAVAYNDVDYGYRLTQNGWRCIYCPEAELFHFEGKSRAKRDNPREVVNLRRRYGDFIDPSYNPNLSLDNEHFQPASRRRPGHSKDPIRICAFSHNLNFEGAPNTLFDLLVGLQQTGQADVVVLAPADGPLRGAYEDAGIPVHFFESPHVGTDVCNFEKRIAALADVYDKFGANVVIANTLPMFFAVNAAERAGVGSIWCQHESEPWETYFDAEQLAVQAYAYAAFGQAYRVTYVAEATRRGWAAVQTRDNAQVVRHGVPPERIEMEIGRWTREEARRHLEVGQGEIVLILMGTVCRRKGQLDLLQALAQLESRASVLKVFVVGALAEAEYAALLNEHVRGLSAELASRIKITGTVTDMTVYYAAADICICTSRVESAPRVIVEAMAFSLPIITTPVFGIPEVVEADINAIFYEPGEAEELSRRIAELMDDPRRRHGMASHSRDVLESRPGYRDMLQHYAVLIREAAVSRSPRRLMASPYQVEGS
ncbi:glycosyltransferase [Brevundimonas sp. SGAir0440]|uniref:glycosyltransferase n=1 Tax=Brevundimonas sp. SGAir0440 TaxID=2579977 RepID=UPI0010CCB31E|nr:glycosyltransferase [Brevundimonas sp. SGAir0440]QCQ97577.1 glycosyltransferase [Brevundimonas sp. SGAir0440]